MKVTKPAFKRRIFSRQRSALAERFSGSYFWLLPMLYVLAYSLHITPLNADLYHLFANGQTIVQSQYIPQDNFYSYTFQNRAFPNVSWLSDVILYLAYWLSGWAGVHLFCILLTLLAYGTIWHFTYEAYSQRFITGIMLLLTPLVFSAGVINDDLIAGIIGVLFWGIIIEFLQNKHGYRDLLFLPPLQLFWVNAHWTALLGIIGVVLMLIHEFTHHPHHFKERRRWIVGITLACIAVMWLNPRFTAGWANAFVIPKEGILTVLQTEGFNFVSVYSLLLSVVLFLGIVAYIIATREWLHWLPLASLLLCILPFFSWHGASIQAMLSIYCLLGLWNTFVNDWSMIRFRKFINKPVVLILATVFLVSIGFYINIKSFNPLIGNWGLGVEKTSKAAIDFLVQNDVKGPLLNNRSMGDQLLFHINTPKSVFIDSREGAYPQDFIEDYYFPRLAQPSTWMRIKSSYQPNALVFDLKGSSEAVFQFLGNRLAEEEWVMVFEKENESVIFVRRVQQNADLIRAYEITL